HRDGRAAGKGDGQEVGANETCDKRIPCAGYSRSGIHSQFARRAPARTARRTKRREAGYGFPSENHEGTCRTYSPIVAKKNRILAPSAGSGVRLNVTSAAESSSATTSGASAAATSASVIEKSSRTGPWTTAVPVPA